ncbi:hypothetical protein CYY_000978 [Polysphondylium violaceum]|uniref:MACPF domain-containing protein n=1 Tax=Polysphondylium violaceum TaxID=133409 RepID=A0A8J4UWP1_9MYCE|nr:hypothetical protein CYY_000978 [Polysphondylium violaceum]
MNKTFIYLGFFIYLFVGAQLIFGAPQLKSYKYIDEDIIYNTDSCDNLVYHLSIYDNNVLLPNNIVLSTPSSVQSITVYTIKSEAPNYIFAVTAQALFSPDIGILTLSATNEIGENSIMSLDNTPVVCQHPNTTLDQSMFSFSKPNFKNNIISFDVKVDKTKTRYSPTSSSVSTNITSDYSTSISVYSTLLTGDKYVYRVSVIPSITKLMASQTFTVKFTFHAFPSTLEIELENPFNLRELSQTAPPTFDVSYPPLAPIQFSETDYDLNSVVIMVTNHASSNRFLAYTSKNRNTILAYPDRPIEFIPTFSGYDPILKDNTFLTAIIDLDDNITEEKKIIDVYYLLEKDGQISLENGSLHFNFTGRNKLAWLPSVSTVSDSTLNMGLVKMMLGDVPMNRNPIIQDFSGKSAPYPFPYGYSGSGTDGLVYSVSQIAPISSSRRYYGISSDRQHSYYSGSYMSPANTINDISAPVVKSYNIKKYTSNIIVLTLEVTDQGSGVREFYCSTPSVTYNAIDTLVSGTLNNGIFELVFDLSKDLVFYPNLEIQIYDFFNNFNTLPYLSFDVNESKQLVGLITVSDFTYLKFNHESIDTTFGRKKSSLFFRVNDLPLDYVPQLAIIESSLEFTNSEQQYQIFQGKYHQGLEMFVIEFEVPSKLYDRNVDYMLFAPTKFDGQTLETKFGSDARLYLTSEYFDNYPPIIRDFTFTASHQVEIDVDQEIEIGWDFRIIDQSNGFSYGTFEITSDKDGSPFVFNITSLDRIKGNDFDGIYPVTFKVYGNTVDQTFSISAVSLYDKNGRVSTYPSWEYPTRISPLYLLSKDHSIKVVCKNVVSVNKLAPSLKPVDGFSHSFNEADRVITFTLKVIDNGGKGFSPFSKHNPIVYIDGIYEHIKVQTEVCSSCANTASLVTYTASVQLSYNLIISGCSFSVFGIVDRHLNFYGANSIELKQLGFLSTFKTSNVAIFPVISSLSSISDMGGDITIYGQRFPAAAKLYTQSDAGAFVERQIKFISSTMIIATMPSSKTDIQIKVLYSANTYTNTLTVSPTKSSKKKFVYVSPTHECVSGCGTHTNPYKTIKSALLNSDPFSETIILLPGIYSGLENNEILISQYREIFSLAGPETTIIDCEGYTYAIHAQNAKRLVLSGITFRNCVNDQGGALHLYKTPTKLVNVDFVNNNASNGGAIFVYGQELAITDSIFYKNKVINHGAAIYSDLAIVKINGDLTYFAPIVESSNTDMDGRPKDILCKNSSIKVDTSVSMYKVDFECLDGCDSAYSNKPLCLNTKSNKKGKSICDTESCLTRPDECSCLFSGLVLETYAQDCDILNVTKCKSLNKEPSQQVELTNHLGGFDVVVNRFYGYISVSESKYLTFLFTGSNYGFIFKINAVQQDSMYQNTRFNQTKTIYLTHKHVNFIEIIVFSTVSQGSQRSFRMTPLLSINDDMFYSNLICGDKVKDKLETIQFYENPIINDDDEDDNIPNIFYCAADLPYPSLGSEPECGDGICNDVKPCFKDCFNVLTKSCPTRTVPDGHIAPGFFFSSDTLGDLISNQFMWKLPGSDHLTFGVDIVSGEEASAPIFQFDYCQHIAQTVMEDIYRGNVYLLPDQINARPLPECSYSSSTEMHESSSEISKSMEESSSQSYEASASGSYMGSGASLSAAFSLEKSSKESNRIALHPNLLKSLSEVEDVEGVVELVKMYGTHYYISTYLGGKLSQLTIAKSSDATSEKESSYSSSAAASLSASVNSPSFSVSASVSGSLDSSNDENEAKSNSESSTTSRILTYGGVPAAFSPAQDGESSPTYSDWSSTIDLLPVPIDYRLAPIRDLISDTWFSKNNNETNLQQLWLSAEDIYYAMNNFDPGFSTDSFSIIFELDVIDGSTSFTTNSFPVLDVKYWINQKVGNVTKKVEKNFFVDLDFVHIDNNGSQFYHLYSNNLNEAMGTCGEYTAFDRDYSNLWSTKKKSCDYGSIANMKYPIRLEFEAPDFFLSVDRPEIKLTFNDPRVKIKNDNPIKIISWKRNQAILVDSNGVIDNYGKPESEQEYYATTAFESRWAWHTSKHLAKSAFSNGRNTGIDCSLIPDSCSDLVRFKFDEPTQYSNSDTRPVPKDRTYTNGFFRDFNQNSPIINWYSFKGPIDEKFKKGILQVDHDSKIGTLTRINWVKAYYPNSENTWFFDIKGYHIKDFQEPKYHSKEFIEVNFDKYTPQDRFSPFKWYQLYPLNDAATKESIKTRQLYFYHNYNFNIKGVYSYQLDGNYDANKAPTYDYVLLQGIENSVFMDNGNSYSFKN